MQRGMDSGKAELYAQLSQRLLRLSATIDQVSADVGRCSEMHQDTSSLGRHLGSMCVFLSVSVVVCLLGLVVFVVLK